MHENKLSVGICRNHQQYCKSAAQARVTPLVCRWSTIVQEPVQLSMALEKVVHVLYCNKMTLLKT